MNEDNKDHLRLVENETDGIINPNIKLSEAEAISSDNPEVKREILDAQSLVDVRYFGPDKKYYEGQIVVHKYLENEVKQIFEFACNIEYPINQVMPIAMYQFDDELSMAANNSSGFNFRYISPDSKILSLHSFGFAVDINPRTNPVIKNGNITQPHNGIYDEASHEALYKKDGKGYHLVVAKFLELGWVWGGLWEEFKNYHHFEKQLATPEYINYLLQLLQEGVISQERYTELSTLASHNLGAMNEKI
jgi:peptidoglycan LD-endopeptidase CwlK